MKRQVISSSRAPAAIGPYSQAIRAGDNLYCSGQIPLNPEGKMVEGGIEAQARQVFDNLTAVLQEAGAGTEDVVRLTIYLQDFGDFGSVNQVMRERFSEPYPARTTIQVAALPLGALIEVDAIAVPGD